MKYSPASFPGSGLGTQICGLLPLVGAGGRASKKAFPGRTWERAMSQRALK